MKTEGFYEIEGSIEELKNIFFTDSNINRRYDALTTIGYRLITQKQLYKYEEWYHNMEKIFSDEKDVYDINNIINKAWYFLLFDERKGKSPKPLCDIAASYKGFWHKYFDTHFYYKVSKYIPYAITILSGIILWLFSESNNSVAVLFGGLLTIICFMDNEDDRPMNTFYCFLSGSIMINIHIFFTDDSYSVAIHDSFIFFCCLLSFILLTPFYYMNKYRDKYEEIRKNFR